MENNFSYNTVVNRPIACSFCGIPVHGRVIDVKTVNNATEKLCKWICAKCGNLVKVGKVE